MNNIYEITSENWQTKIGGFGQIVEDLEDFNQRISIVLNTIKGSVPHNPAFGSDIWEYIDLPIGEAIPNIVREATDSLQAWIPELDFVIAAKPQNNNVDNIARGNLVISVDWTFKNTTIGDNVEIKPQ